MNSKLATIIILLLLTLVISSGASAEYSRNSVIPAPALAPIGTAFTYQGSLTDGGSPANGAYDFEFKLFNDASVGTQVGSTKIQGDVITSEGIFTVELDFGNVFNGTAYWLEIWVRPGASTGSYQQLLPRQSLTAVPYSNFALNALNADTLDGMQGSYYRNASNINIGTLNNERFDAYDDLIVDGHFGESIYQVSYYCGGTSSMLTTDFSCMSILCAANPPLYWYYGCNGGCTQTSQQLCSNDNLGRLLKN